MWSRAGWPKPPGRAVEVHYAEMDIFRHVDPRVPLNPLTFLADLIELLFQVCRLMLRLA